MTIEITGQQAEVSVGEKIKLGVKVNVGLAILKSVEWKIPGTIVKNYEDNQISAKVTKIEEADKKKEAIEFFWVDGGDGRVVEAACVFKTASGAETKKTISAKFDVKAPVLDKLSAAVDVVQFNNPGSPTRFGLGVGLTKPGIKWDWKVTIPSVVDGYLKDVQTIKTITKQTLVIGTKQVWTRSGTKVPPSDVQLDTTNPYSGPGDFHATKGFPHLVSAGSSYDDNFTFDSPSNPLSGTQRSSVHDQFKYYVMYKPKKTDAIWVPVGVAEWSWEGEAVFNIGTGLWSLVGAAAGVTAGVKTTEFPEYPSNVGSNILQNE